MRDFGLIHVTRPEQAEEMRGIRNSCREFMTGESAKYEITAEDQVVWFRMLPADFLPFLYRQPNGVVMGYGIVRKEDDRWWISGGLSPEYRNQGFGKYLFGELSHYVTDQKLDCWLKVLGSNIRAFNTYRSIGFVEQSVTSGTGTPTIITMRRQHGDR